MGKDALILDGIVKPQKQCGIISTSVESTSRLAVFLDQHRNIAVIKFNLGNSDRNESKIHRCSV